MEKVDFRLVEADTSALLDATVTEVSASTDVTSACARMKEIFDAWHREPRALCFLERLLERGADRTMEA